MNLDVMSVRLWLPRIRVLGVFVNVPERPGGAGGLDGAPAQVSGLRDAQRQDP